MDVFKTITTGITLFGSGLYFLITVERLAIKSAYEKNYALIATKFLSGFILLELGLILNNIPARYPVTVFCFLTALYLLGPMSLIMFYSQVYPESPQTKRLRYHLLPALFIFMGEILFQIQSVDFKKELIEGLFLSPTYHPLTPVWIIGALHVSLYYLFGFKICVPFRNTENIRTGVRILLLVSFIAFCAIILLFIGFFIQLSFLFQLGCILISIIHIFVFIGMHREPDFFQLFHNEAQKQRYEKSLLLAVDLQKIVQKLDNLMNTDKIYMETDITLKMLSEKLEMTPHQLSQYLNEKLDLNFRNYINKFRVEESKRLLTLVDKPNILNICYKVGFNSVSAFNRAFKKFTGSAPSEFLNKKS